MASVMVAVLTGMLPCFASDLPENSGAASSGAQVFPDIRIIKERGRLIVAQSNAETPPFSMIANERSAGTSEALRFVLPDGQTVVGIDVSMAKAIARALGVRLDLQRDHPTSRSVIDAVSRGEADLGISNLGVTSARLQKVLFSAPYAVFSSSLLIRRNCLPTPGANPGEFSPHSPLVRSLDHPNSRVAVESPGSFEELFAVLFPNATAVPYGSDADLFRLLTTQNVDAALGDEFRFRLQTQLHPELALYYALMDIPDHQERIAVAINPGMPHLGPIADEAARQYKTSSTGEFFAAHASLLEFHLGAASSPASPVLSGTTGPHRPPSGQKHQAASTRDEAFPLRPAGALGLLLLSFTAAWLQMSKTPSPSLHGKQTEK